MIYMCFDFGTFSWGVAIGDSLSQTAKAIGSLEVSQRGLDEPKLDRMIDQWQPQALVIGYPLKADGGRFQLTDKVDVAIEWLKSRYPALPLHPTDEHLTTVEAKAELYARKGKKGLEKGQVDAESAKLILLRWFETQALSSNEHF